MPVFGAGLCMHKAFILVTSLSPAYGKVVLCVSYSKCEHAFAAYDVTVITYVNSLVSYTSK